MSAEEVRKDIERMEEEREQLQNRLCLLFNYSIEYLQLMTSYLSLIARLSNLKKRAEQVPNFSKNLEACHSLRKERDDKSDLAEKLQMQRVLISQADTRRMKLSEELKAIQARGDRMSGGALLSMSEDELRLKRVLAVDQLPSEVTHLQT